MKYRVKGNLFVMQSLSRDTPPEVQRLLFELLRDAPPSKKIALTFDLIQTARLVVLAGLRHRFPMASEAQLRRHLVSKLLPREEVIKAYGFDPKIEDH
jgi:hypothetical protein